MPKAQRRRRAVRKYRDDHDLDATGFAQKLGISESAASHQLRLLRSLRLVRSRREGRMVFYRLDDDHIVRLLDQGLEHAAEPGAGREER